MELVIYKPTDDQFVKTIDFNFDELKQEITSALEKYQGLVYTDDSIKDAKTDRATLNKFKRGFRGKKGRKSRSNASRLMRHLRRKSRSLRPCRQAHP